MTTTISSGGTTITPTLVLGHATEQAAQAVRHDIIGQSLPSYTLAPDRARSGSHRLLFNSVTLAEAARVFLSSKKVFVLVSTEIPQIGMTFIRDGAMTLALDETDERFWLLTVGYQEVAA